MSKDLIKEQFGAAAAAYAVSKVHAQGASLGRLVELVNPQPDWQVLDVATGAGHTAFTFAPHVAHVVASDITTEMLKTAEGLAQKKGLTNLSFQEADAEALPFPNATFHLVTCRIAPHHFGNIGRFVAETTRVLKPGGVCAVVDNIVPGEQEAGGYVNAFEKLRDPSHNCCLSLEEWVNAFQQAGFTIVAAEEAPKEIEFMEWAQRMNATEDTIQQLRAMLLDAPPAVADFLTPQRVENDILFYLREAIVIGRL